MQKPEFLSGMGDFIGNHRRDQTPEKLQEQFQGSIVVKTISGMAGQWVILARAKSTEQVQYEELILPLIEAEYARIRQDRSPPRPIPKNTGASNLIGNSDSETIEPLFADDWGKLHKLLELSCQILKD